MSHRTLMGSWAWSHRQNSPLLFGKWQSLV